MTKRTTQTETTVIEVCYQRRGNTWGVYKREGTHLPELLEGGFFAIEAAEKIAEEHAKERGLPLAANHGKRK